MKLRPKEGKLLPAGIICFREAGDLWGNGSMRIVFWCWDLLVTDTTQRNILKYPRISLCHSLVGRLFPQVLGSSWPRLSQGWDWCFFNLPVGLNQSWHGYRQQGGVSGSGVPSEEGLHTGHTSRARGRSRAGFLSAATRLLCLCLPRCVLTPLGTSKQKGISLGL